MEERSETSRLREPRLTFYTLAQLFLVARDAPPMTIIRFIAALESQLELGERN
jgi:hypothetical protein